MACGILLKELKLVEAVALVHAKDVESGKFEITDQDITAGLPYKEKARMAFDHHAGAVPPPEDRLNLAVDTSAPSTARVIYNYFGKDKFPDIHEDVLDAVDKDFSAKITPDDILYPTGWTLLNYLIDQRTGLERQKRFRVSHDELMNHLMDRGGRSSVWELLRLADVEERLDLYFSCFDDHKSQLMRCSSVFHNLVVTDTRAEILFYSGNKFVVYALFPECNVSLDVSLSADGGATVFAAGKSVLDRTFPLDIGRIMREYGGGGHSGAGACRAESSKAPEILQSLIKDMECGFYENLYMGYFNYY